MADPNPDTTSRQNLEQLLGQVAEQDQDALRAVYEMTRRSVFAVAYAVTRDRQLAEDVLQDTIVRVWEQSGRYRSSGSPLAWVHTIARNLALDVMRQRHRLVHTDFSDDMPLPDALVSHADPTDRISLEAGLNQLDPDDAVIFVFKVLAGLSHLESARLLDLPYRQVRYRYQRAIRQLRRFLAEPNSPGR